MYRGGKICLTDHFKPLWARNVPKFGIAHAMALGVRFPFLNIFFIITEIVLNICIFQLSPWLAVEIPDLIEKGIISYKDKSES